jgi:hypothetical protein
MKNRKQLCDILNDNGVKIRKGRISKPRRSKFNGRFFSFVDFSSPREAEKAKIVLSENGIEYVQPIQKETVSVYMDWL